MSKRLKSTDFPDDNSHLPVTLKPGDRTGFWRTVGTERKFFSTPANLLESIDMPGHHPTFVFEGIDRWGRTVGTLSCSCGYTVDASRWFNSGIKWSRTGPTYWKSHTNSLAAPIHIWTAQGPRARYECYVCSHDQAKNTFNARWVYGDSMLFVVITSTHGSTSKVYASRPDLDGAMAEARNHGRTFESLGRTITWHEDPVVTEVSTSVADLLTAIQNQGTSDDLRTLLEAKKLADEFLAFTEPITEVRDQIQARIDNLFSFDD